jgi:hypothetical protein
VRRLVNLICNCSECGQEAAIDAMVSTEPVVDHPGRPTKAKIELNKKNFNEIFSLNSFKSRPIDD